MLKTTVGVGSLAAGVLISVATLYAVKNKLDVADVLEHVEIHAEKFRILIENLIEYGKEFLIKIYDIISKLAKELMFKVRRSEI